MESESESESKEYRNRRNGKNKKLSNGYYSDDSFEESCEGDLTGSQSGSETSSKEKQTIANKRKSLKEFSRDRSNADSSSDPSNAGSSESDFSSENQSVNEYEDDKSDDDSESEYMESEESEEDTSKTNNHSYNTETPEVSNRYKKKEPIIPDSSEGGRYFYKANACPYCDVIRQRLDKHLLTMHRDKKTVQKIELLPKRSPLRFKLFSLLTNIGNEKFNKDEQRNPEKILLVKRRLSKARGKNIKYLKNKKQVHALQKSQSTQELSVDGQSKQKKCRSSMYEKKLKKNKKVKRYTPLRVICPVCRAYFSPNSYSKHFKSQHGDIASKDTRTLLSAARRELDEYHPNASLELITYVLPYLTDDNVGIMCRYDELAIAYGNKYIEQYVADDQAKQVKSHMRLLMRVLCEMKKLDPGITDLKSAIKPHRFDTFIEAAKIICKVNKKILGVVYNGHTIRMLWNRIFDILDAQYSKISSYRKRRRKRESLQSYKASFKNEYLSKIGSKAQRTDNMKRRLKAKDELIDSQDLQIFAKFLNENVDRSLRCLVNDGYDEHNYFTLMNYLMTFLMLFNGRRPGEMDRCRLTDFENRIKSDPDDEYFKQLNDNQKEQHNKYEKILSQGKKIDGIDSTIYVTKKQINAFRVLLKYRENAGIHPENDYLFAYPHIQYDPRMKHADAHITMSKIVDACQAETQSLKKPHLLKSTKCRIQIATLFSAIDDPQELENITTQLAHSKNVHYKRYRKTIPKTDVQVTKFLEKRLQTSDNDDLENDTFARTLTDLSKQSNESTNNSKNDVSVGKTTESRTKRKTSVKKNQLVFSKKTTLSKSKHDCGNREVDEFPEGYHVSSKSYQSAKNTQLVFSKAINKSEAKENRSGYKKNDPEIRSYKRIRNSLSDSEEDLDANSEVSHPHHKKKLKKLEPSAKSDLKNKGPKSNRTKSSAGERETKNKRGYHLSTQSYQSVKNTQLVFSTAINKSESKKNISGNKKNVPEIRSYKRIRNSLSDSEEDLDANSEVSHPHDKKKLKKLEPSTKSDLKNKGPKSNLTKSSAGERATENKRGRGTTWTAQEINSFNSSFARELKKGIYANASQIRMAMASNPCLQAKGPQAIRTRFSNIYSKEKKKISAELKIAS